MATQVRVKGFVVGYDVKTGELVWTVKVKDLQSPHNGHKFEVVSCHPGTMLSRPAVDVTFVIAVCQVGGQPVLKAADVAIGVDPPKDRNTKSEVHNENDETINVAVTVMDGKYLVWTTGHESVEESTRELDPDGTEKAVVLVEIPVHPGLEEEDFRVREGMAAVATLIYLDPLQAAFEKVMSDVVNAVIQKLTERKG
jgi:hypothetical protein